jgi:hypothetical protein
MPRNDSRPSASAFQLAGMVAHPLDLAARQRGYLESVTPEEGKFSGLPDRPEWNVAENSDSPECPSVRLPWLPQNLMQKVKRDSMSLVRMMANAFH